MTIPENILSLHVGEEFLRNKTFEAIEKDEYLPTDLSVIEKSMDLVNYFVNKYDNEEDQDLLTIQLLGIRLFNGSASSLRLLLCGYYQTSALQIRDLLETIFLLDYFHIDKNLISKWRESDKSIRRKEFGPAKIREALDARDSFTKKKRDKAYALLCNLAGHPTYEGFRMLTPVHGGDAHCGPYFEFENMKATLEELSNKLVEAGVIFTRFFEKRNDTDRKMNNRFLEGFGEWRENLNAKSRNSNQE